MTFVKRRWSTFETQILCPLGQKARRHLPKYIFKISLLDILHIIGKSRQHMKRLFSPFIFLSYPLFYPLQHPSLGQQLMIISIILTFCEDISALGVLEHFCHFHNFSWVQRYTQWHIDNHDDHQPHFTVVHQVDGYDCGAEISEGGHGGDWHNFFFK